MSIPHKSFSRNPRLLGPCWSPADMIALDPRTTALVLIDLQNGILGRKLAPATAEELVARGKALVEKFRAAGALVVLVNAAPVAEDKPRAVDEPSGLPRTLPAGFVDLAPGLAEPGDILITKSTWGAFFRTDLDSELKHRGVSIIVLGGVATQFGVESTARQAWELGYELVIVKDATTSIAIEAHDNSMRHIFPRIARVAEGDALAFRD
jgi:nicotinamidase-related amidase